MSEATVLRILQPVVSKNRLPLALKYMSAGIERLFKAEAMHVIINQLLNKPFIHNNIFIRYTCLLQNRQHRSHLQDCPGLLSRSLA